MATHYVGVARLAVTRNGNGPTWKLLQEGRRDHARHASSEKPKRKSPLDFKQQRPVQKIEFRQTAPPLNGSQKVPPGPKSNAVRRPAGPYGASTPKKVVASRTASQKVEKPRRLSDIVPVIQHTETITAERSKELGPIYALIPGDTNFFQLKDGRTMSYARLGRAADNGPVLVCFHGRPGTRLEALYLHSICERARIRLICIDRPGYGHSTSNLANKNGLQVAQDTLELLDHLELPSFYGFGVSAGGQHALAFAKVCPKDRLLATGIMCGTAPRAAGRRFGKPRHRAEEFVAGRFPRLFALYWDTWQYFDDFLSALNGQVPHVQALRIDHRWLNPDNWTGTRFDLGSKAENERKVRDYLVDIETFRQGEAGYAEDMHRSEANWGFEIKDVDANPTIMYHGTTDLNCPYQWAQYIRARLKNSELHTVEYDDHKQIQAGGNTQKLIIKVLSHGRS